MTSCTLSELESYALEIISFDALLDFKMVPQEPTLASGEPGLAPVEMKR